MNKHSPGPWEVECKIDEDGDHIWWINTPYVEPAAAKCFDPYNAQFISSAPDMYEALKRALMFMENGVDNGYIQMPDIGDPALETPNIIRKALAKAEGGDTWWLM
jgi:hypothetical protein